MVQFRRRAIVSAIAVFAASFSPSRTLAQGIPDTVAAMVAWSQTAPTLQALTDASVATVLLPLGRRGE
jgi:hypothetical protein